jgi:hypothetical protein
MLIRICINSTGSVKKWYTSIHPIVIQEREYEEKVGLQDHKADREMRLLLVVWILCHPTRQFSVAD